MVVVKWQRALVTPFRINATALEAVQLLLVSTLFTGKKIKYDLRASYAHKKGNHFNTVNLLFKHIILVV